ncbi:hypothetical protein [Antribacter gilvus]|uniref:hypothetical protein n=1 Tax=Antribacter gilvus TaxID=2304675 RepID=UPI000F793DCC|nr:hypothetical protein [Antribacter gilvus]
MVEHLRDAATAAAAFGLPAFLWLAWAVPHTTRRRQLGVVALAGFAAATTVAGIALTIARWDEPTALTAPLVSVYLVVLALHAAVVRVCAGFASKRGKADLVPTLVAVLGSPHFFVLGELLSFPALGLGALAATVAGLLAGPAAKVVGTRGPATVGVVTGLAFLATSAGALAAAAS